MKVEQISSASTKELVAFYNKNCECFGKRPVVKFSDRMTAEIRVKTMIEDIEAVAAEEAASQSAPSTIAICLGLANMAPQAVVAAETEVRKELAENIEEDNKARHDIVYDGEHCPHCGIHLSNGVGEHNQEVNGIRIKHETHELCCLACGEEFGAALKGRRAVNSTGKVREAMITSLKLDRTITAYDENMVQLGTWGNACQMWKQNLDWMTSAQQDGLTAKLYKAAKQGEKIRVVINGRTFELVNV